MKNEDRVPPYWFQASNGLVCHFAKYTTPVCKAVCVFSAQITDGDFSFMRGYQIQIVGIYDVALQSSGPGNYVFIFTFCL